MPRPRKGTRLGGGPSQEKAMMNNLAMLYESQGVFDKSEPLYNRTIILNEKTFGEINREGFC